MTRLADLYFKALKAVIAFLLAGMVILVFGNVVLRYGFNSGITISEELSRWFFVWLVFLGAIVALRERSHLGIDSLVKRFPAVGRKALFALSHALMILMAVFFAKGSWDQTLVNLHVSATATGLSIGLYYGIGLIFSASAVAILAAELWNVLSGKVDIDDLIASNETELG